MPRTSTAPPAFLVQTSTPDGLIGGGKAEPRPMYGHGFGMLFLSQLYGMTEDVQRTQTLHDILTRGVDLTGRAQSVLGGWMYTPDAQRDEGSVTITQVQALRSCRNVGIAVPKDVIDKAMSYLEISQNTDGASGTPPPKPTAGRVPPLQRPRSAAGSTPACTITMTRIALWHTARQPYSPTPPSGGMTTTPTSTLPRHCISGRMRVGTNIMPNGATTFLPNRSPTAHGGVTR